MSCKQETGLGISHNCTPNSAKKNIADLTSQQSTTGQEQILSEGLKNIVKEKSGEFGSQMRFTVLQGGNPLSVTLGKAPTNQETILITSDVMAQLQKKLGCSERKLLMVAQEFKAKGIKFENHIWEI